MNYTKVRVSELEPGDTVFDTPVDKTIECVGKHGSNHLISFTDETTRLYKPGATVQAVCAHRRHYETAPQPVLLATKQRGQR